MIMVLPLFLQVAFGVTVSATVDRTSLSLDDVLELKIESVDGDDSPQADISPLRKNFLVVNGPSQQTNISWVNGKMTSTRGLSWTLSPKKTGTILLPSLTVTVGKARFRTKQIPIKVLNNTLVNKRGGNSKKYFIQMDVDKHTAFPGEQITVTYQLFTQSDLSIESVEIPEFVGFWIENLYSPRQINLREVNVKGVRYKKAKLYTVALFPTKTGTIPIDPYVLNTQIVVENKKSKRRDPFFDVFGSFSSRQTVKKILKSESKSINVKSFPEGKPPDFTGAVGQYTVKTSVDNQNVKTNEAVTFFIEVKGTGNLSLFSLPDIIFPNSLEVFPPVSELKKDSFRDKITGNMRWEYVVIPRQTGRFNLPKVELPFFEPKSEQWKRTIANAIQISVSPGKIPVTSPKGLTKSEIALIGKDIRYHKTEIPNWNQNNRIPITAVLCYTLAVCGFIVPGMVNNYRKISDDGKAFRQSKKALKKAITQLKKGGEDEFELCTSTLYTYLKEKYFLQTDKLDSSRIQFLLSSQLSTEEINSIIQLLNRCDAARFSPEGTHSKSSIIDETILLLKNINRHEN
jgi:hypothetical protein